MTSERRSTENFKPTDLWWLTSGTLAAIAMGIAALLEGSRWQNTSWFLYFTAWLPALIGALWCIETGRAKALAGLRNTVLVLGFATFNLTAFHRDGFPF